MKIFIRLAIMSLALAGLSEAVLAGKEVKMKCAHNWDLKVVNQYQSGPSGSYSYDVLVSNKDGLACGPNTLYLTTTDVYDQKKQPQKGFGVGFIPYEIRLEPKAQTKIKMNLFVRDVSEGLFRFNVIGYISTPFVRENVVQSNQVFFQKSDSLMKRPPIWKINLNR